MAFAETPQETKINRVAIRASFPSRLKYSGAVSGEEYEWTGAGDIVMVLEEDVPTLLEKRIGERGCCGAVQQSNKVFEMV